MNVIVNNKSDKNKVIDFIRNKRTFNDIEFRLIDTHPPNVRNWLKSSGIYDSEIESNRKKCSAFEDLINSERSLILISNSLPNCEARFSFDLITLILTETEHPMTEIDDEMTVFALGDSYMLYKARIIVIQKGDFVCCLLNFLAICGLNDHINICFNELAMKIDTNNY